MNVPASSAGLCINGACLSGFASFVTSPPIDQCDERKMVDQSINVVIDLIINTY